jgi:hypothetical protein
MPPPATIAAEAARTLRREIDPPLVSCGLMLNLVHRDCGCSVIIPLGGGKRFR